ncbi:MAG: SpoIIE family protein phosphatase [Leptospiraceae bacterium]|jgi:serine phosphatase RsbU (regulator of sigma subunit)|nr:SpoIIE family protein phosphatase [Leptospiraceae bacterium]
MLHNFFTVADLNYGIFTIFAAFYLISIKNKNENTIHLIIFMFVLGFMDVTYFLSSLFVHPWGKFHRYITVPAALLGTVHVAYFIMNYPRRSWKLFPKIYFYTFYAIDLIITIAFIYTSLKVGQIYRFDGHFWDFNEVFWGQIVGLFILINALFAIVSGIIRSIQIKQARLQILLIVIGFILIVLIPAITNLLNRLFIITRDEHQNIWGLFGITGSFIVLVTYVNYTKERTTLLSKLYAISLLTVLIILQLVNFFVLQERNRLYNEIHKEKNHRIIQDLTYRPESLEMIVKILPNLNFETIYNKTNLTLPKEEFISEAALMMLQHQYLNHLTISEEIKPFTIGYLNWIQEIERTHPEYSREQVLKEIYKNKRKIQLLRSNIENLPENNFKEKYQKSILEKNQNASINKYFVFSLVEDKKDALSFIPIIHDFDQLLFRYLNLSNDFWKNTYVFYYSIEQNHLYLIGYSYKDYRIFVSEIANILFYIIVISSILILSGYPVFFLVSVLRPLKKLMYGLHRVNHGDLSVSLEVNVHDELGYVTRSFNKMVDSIRDKNKQLEEYANMLELKVEERTRDLEKSLIEIEKLKEKQDGDYYLTSLLVKPLNSNEIGQEDIVKVDFVISQYKKFQYKRWKSEIGGDFCCAHRIQLKNKNYSFVVNADAMGKSIQGAGGSLVLGSVLEAIVERTKYQEEVKELFPEKWLKYAFVELHKVIESLDGSMYITLVMLLIDEDFGLMYYLNAEHPDIVLYRNQKAMYIKPNRYLIKLGYPVEGFINISTFKLEAGDIILVGSDGKDDLVIGYNEDGTKKINIDDNFFLEIVEESKGDLKNIYNNLCERGEFIDDVSIIRVEYTPQPEKINKRKLIHTEDKLLFEDAKNQYKKYIESKEEEFLVHAVEQFEKLVDKYPMNYLFRKYLIHCLIKQKQFTRAILQLEELQRYYPENTEILVQIIKLLYKKKIYSKAAEYIEIYLLRNPSDWKILSIAVDIYEKLGNKNKLKKYQQELEKLAVN